MKKRAKGDIRASGTDETARMRPAGVRAAGMAELPGKANHWYVPASDKTVHWGYFSKKLTPLIEIDSGDYATIECLTHQAGDDPERVREGMSGNLCRCGAYQGITEAILEAQNAIGAASRRKVA